LKSAADCASGAWIGTSGWSYDAWRDEFYAGVPRERWLAHYAWHFDAVEVNATFYHTLARATSPLARADAGAVPFRDQGPALRHA
jgi:hypothetical protein